MGVNLPRLLLCSLCCSMALLQGCECRHTFFAFVIVFTIVAFSGRPWKARLDGDPKFFAETPLSDLESAAIL